MKTRGLAIGLTGGIACGKSVAGNFLAEQGIPVLDTDLVARKIMEPDQPVFDAVVAHFGTGIVDDQGRIDRARLAGIVFADAGQRHALNACVHPAVREKWRRWLDEQVAVHRAAAVLIPLLFETGARPFFDAVLCVTASTDIVMDRLRQRGLTDEEAQLRIASQMPVDKKAQRSDFTLDNNGSLDDLKIRVREILDELLNEGV